MTAAGVPLGPSLGYLRRQLGFTQTEVANGIGTTQGAVSRLERQDDMLVSTLAAYAAALGGRLVLSVEHVVDDLLSETTELRLENDELLAEVDELQAARP